MDQRQREVQELARQESALRDQVSSIAAQAAGGTTPAQRAADERLAQEAGLTAVSGPAVRVILDDAPHPDSGRTLPGDPNPDLLVVHQQDVQAVVNALWAGGARAMQIMDQRVISTSAVRCVGNTLLLHGVVYSPPYVITAVGDPAALRRALDASPDVQIYKQYVSAYQLGYDVKVERKVKLPAYDGPLELQHAQAVTG